jgi:hypothetical protein
MSRPATPEYAARCLCGGIRIRITARPGPVVACHCRSCRKHGGSAFATNAGVGPDDWHLEAGAELAREFESSPGTWRAFCGRCGSSTWARSADAPGVHRIRLGLVARDPERRVSMHCWREDGAPWYALSDGLPACPREPRGGVEGG